jgi:hypothetical protein
MKRAVFPALALALLLSVPAISQEEVDLGAEVTALKKKVEEQDAALKLLQQYVDNQKRQAGRLGKSLSTAEKEGFLLPAPNNDAKEALLSGLKDFAQVAAGGAPATDEGSGEE